MSLIKFTTHVNMTTSATPSSGISMGLDLDGVLKQKNTLGVISSIGTGSGSSGTSGKSGSSGVNGDFLGSSGTSGKSGSSGTSGDGGIDGANSLRWTYGSRSNSKEFQLDVSNFAEFSNVIGINVNNLYSDVTNWLTSIGTYVTSYPGQIYLQITQANSADIFGIYKINNANDNSTFWSFDVESISSNGSPEAGRDYSINWVAFGGVNGSTGSSGTSGKSGSSGYSGVDSANTLKWKLDNTLLATTSQKFDTGGLLDTSIVANISINKTSLNSLVTNWLTTIDTAVTANPDSVYLQITKSDDSNIFGIYTLSTSNDNSTHYTFGVGSVISSSGNLVEGGDHSISFIIQGAGTSGTSGAAGSSGTSGANGSSGTSGSNGSSGTSGANGSSGTSGSSGYSGTPNTTNPIISSSPFTLPISILSAEPEFYQVDTSSNEVTIQLPSITTGPIPDGKIIYIKDIRGSASSNQITISPYSSQTIDGVTNSMTISTNYGVNILIKVDTGWLIIM